MTEVAVAGKEKTANRLLAESRGKGVLCRKVVKTAKHCPDRHCELLCTTEKQVHNFFTGDQDHPNRPQYKANPKRSKGEKQKKTEAEGVGEEVRGVGDGIDAVPSVPDNA